MKTTNTKKSVKNNCFWKSTLIFTVLLVFLFPILSEAGSMKKAGPPECQKWLSVKHRPISDFLKAQGTTSQFFPPVQDYLGWTDDQLNPVTFVLVDYAGLADNYIKDQTKHSLGTKMRGSVTECLLAGGKTQITVALSTTKALGFAQSVEDLANNNFDFLNTPTIFGAKAQDVVKGAEPAVGPVTLLATFSISGPGSPLPDLIDVLNNNPANYAPIKFSITSTTVGKRTDGTKATLYVQQVASTDPNDKTKLIWAIETVEIVDAVD